MKYLPIASRRLWALIGLGIILVPASALLPARLTAQPATSPVPAGCQVAPVGTGGTPAMEAMWKDALAMAGIVEGRTSEVRPVVDGVVSHVNCDLGQAVKRGDLLFQLDDTSARAQLAAAQAQYEGARAKAEVFENTNPRAVSPAMRRAALAEHKAAAALAARSKTPKRR